MFKIDKESSLAKHFGKSLSDSIAVALNDGTTHITDGAITTLLQKGATWSYSHYFLLVIDIKIKAQAQKDWWGYQVLITMLWCFIEFS